MWPIGGIFAYSGGAPVERRRRSTPRRCTRVDENSAGDGDVPRRPDSRARAPHNLYGPAATLFDARRRRRCRRRRCSSTSPTARRLAGDAGASTFHVGFDAGYDPTYTWDAAHRHLEALDRGRARHDRRRRRADRAARTWSCSSSHVRRRRRPRRRPSARATRGSSPTARCARAGGCGPTRPQPAQLRRRRRRADPAAPGPHLGRAAPGRYAGRRRSRAGCPTTTAATAPPRRRRPRPRSKKSTGSGPRYSRPVD